MLSGAPPNVRWTSERDRGQANAINKAFAVARGDSSAGSTRTTRTSIGGDRACRRDPPRRPEVDLVYGHAALVGADNEILQLLWAPRFSARLLRYVNFIVQPTVFIRRSALGETLVDETLEFVVDRELWMRLSRERRGFARLDLVGSHRPPPRVPEVAHDRGHRQTGG